MNKLHLCKQVSILYFDVLVNMIFSGNHFMKVRKNIFLRIMIDFLEDFLTYTIIEQRKELYLVEINGKVRANLKWIIE